ncbi:Uncharacterized protein GY17_00001607 [Cryptosporidium hominis]|uniref:Uncharacterized protein n=2 Tax=Cryptosporidium hominis TaxID=237895 RepID=A0ABX5BEZ7_CRYHO|nr:Uncharacterized protein GY17_00001607 [Cryptosporidium hominis]|eukprot:PPS96688.1 Uncharacterized protein GY17_00001607 [Cryptosporidium hominis]
MDYNFWAGRDDWKDTMRHKIVHFAGPDKPWKINYQPYEEQLLWYKYYLSYPRGEKMIPPIKPKYIFLLKYKHNNNLDNETSLIPEIILKSKKCRFMIHILAINYKGKHKEQFEKQIKSYIKDDFWINYNFLNDSSDKFKDPEELMSQYALFKTPQIFHEYVDKTFLAINKIPNSHYLCKTEEISLKAYNTGESYNYNDNNIFWMDLGIDLGLNNGFNINNSFNQQIKTSGMTTASTSTTYSSTDTFDSENNHINGRIVTNNNFFDPISGINTRNKFLWCIEILHQFYYLNLDLLRMEKKRIEKSVKNDNISSQEIFNSECYKIPPIFNEQAEGVEMETDPETDVDNNTDHAELDDEDSFNNEVNHNDHVNGNIHIQNKFYF